MSFNEGERVRTKMNLLTGVVVENIYGSTFPKVRVRLDGESETCIFYADTLTTDERDPELERIRQAQSEAWEKGMADAKLQALGIRPLVSNPYLED